MSKPECSELRVLENKPLGRPSDDPQTYELILSPPDWESWRPGQFVMLRPADWGADLTWGRPFSIGKADESGLVIYYQVVGRGTGRMADLRPSQRVTVWGPLGNGFVVEPEKDTLLLAGGIGIAPFLGYALAHPAPERLKLVFGSRLDTAYYPYKELSRLISVENHQEKQPEDIDKFIELIGARMSGNCEGLTLACGPAPFLKTVKRFALALKAPAQLSLENRMACGVGACLGCVSNDADGWPTQVCTKGPVFWSDQIQID